LRETLTEIHKLGAELLAVDPHEAWASQALMKDTGLEADDLNYPLLLDPALAVSATYGVAFQMRIHTEWSNRPATFIVDREGILRYGRRAKTFSDRPSVDEILNELAKLESQAVPPANEE